MKRSGSIRFQVVVGGVEVVVDLAEDGDEALLVQPPVFVGEGLAGAELDEDIVYVRDRLAGMRRLLMLAVGVGPLGGLGSLPALKERIDGGSVERGSRRLLVLRVIDHFAWNPSNKATDEVLRGRGRL